MSANYACSVAINLHFIAQVPYPFLTENEFPGRIIIYCGASLLSLCSFYGINEVHKSVYRSSAPGHVKQP